MNDPDTMPTSSDGISVGDVFYCVKQKSNNAFKRTKIHTVIDGVDWFRYSEPLREYEIVTYTVLGYYKTVLYGQWDPNYPDWLGNGYYIHLKTESGVEQYDAHYADWFDENKGDFFVDLSAAIAYKNTLEIESAEMDKT